MDKRILKTKEKLQSALRILLEKKDVSDITVSSLCEVADINRSTFYVYYSNIQDCFEEITDSIMDEMRTLLQNNLNPSQEGFLLVYFRTARKYKNVFLAIHRKVFTILRFKRWWILITIGSTKNYLYQPVAIV